jgi:hypothetical protein
VSSTVSLAALLGMLLAGAGASACVSQLLLLLLLQVPRQGGSCCCCWALLQVGVSAIKPLQSVLHLLPMRLEQCCMLLVCASPCCCCWQFLRGCWHVVLVVVHGSTTRLSDIYCSRSMDMSTTPLYGHKQGRLREQQAAGSACWLADMVVGLVWCATFVARLHRYLWAHTDVHAANQNISYGVLNTLQLLRG